MEKLEFLRKRLPSGIIPLINQRMWCCLSYNALSSLPRCSVKKPALRLGSVVYKPRHCFFLLNKGERKNQKICKRKIILNVELFLLQGFYISEKYQINQLHNRYYSCFGEALFSLIVQSGWAPYGAGHHHLQRTLVIWTLHASKWLGNGWTSISEDCMGYDFLPDEKVAGLMTFLSLLTLMFPVFSFGVMSSSSKYSPWKWKPLSLYFALSLILFSSAFLVWLK